MLHKNLNIKSNMFTNFIKLHLFNICTQYIFKLEPFNHGSVILNYGSYLCYDLTWTMVLSSA